MKRNGTKMWRRNVKGKKKDTGEEGKKTKRGGKKGRKI